LIFPVGQYVNYQKESNTMTTELTDAQIIEKTKGDWNAAQPTWNCWDNFTERDHLLAVAAAVRAYVAADRAQRQAEPEPVAWRTRYKSEAGMVGNYPWTYTERVRAVERLSPSYEFEPLYTAAPPPHHIGEPTDMVALPAQVPLTDAQIEDMRGEANRGFNIERDDYFKAVRDAEAAHGITSR
jgi:hypothetical protein